MVLSLFSFSCVLFLFLQFSNSFFFLSQIWLLRSLHSLIFMATLYSCFSIIHGMIEKVTKFYKGFRSTSQKQLKDRDRLLQVIHLYNTILLFLALLSEEKSQDLRSGSDFHGKKKSFFKKTNSYPAEEISYFNHPQVGIYQSRSLPLDWQNMGSLILCRSCICLGKKISLVFSIQLIIEIYAM